MEMIELLNSEADNLKRRFDGINGWIESNPNTEPNFCEMIDCIVEYGRINSRYNDYFLENGYPSLNGIVVSRHEIDQVVPELSNAKAALGKMINLRSGSDFFKDELAKEYIGDISYRAAYGLYDEPKQSFVGNTKKDVLCKLASVYFYIWETTRREPNYRYDNVGEWNEINEKYALYKEMVGIQERKLTGDELAYEGPQFGYVIEQMMQEVEKNYKYSMPKESGTHK